MKNGRGIYRSLDAGNSWEKLSGYPDFSGKTLLDIYKSNPEVVYASIADAEGSPKLYRTDNFGESWIMIHDNSILGYQGFFSHLVAVHPLNDQRIVHACVKSYSSLDGGTNLTLAAGPWDIHNFALDPFNPNEGFTLAGTWFSLLSGYALLKRKYPGYSALGKLNHRILRYPVGVIGVLIFWYGLGFIFPRSENILGFSLRYFRYMLVGFWVAYLAPIIFVKIGIASTKLAQPEDYFQVK